MTEAIEAVSVSLREYSLGNALTPIRTALPVSDHEGTSLFMPSYVKAAHSLGIKFVSVFPNNKQLGKKTINGVMIITDVSTGEPLALLEASYLTVLRTGAASGLATLHMSRENAKVLSVIGTGAQSRGLIEAVQTVRSIEEIRLFNRTFEKARLLANEINEQNRNINVTIFEHANEAVEGADIIVTATNSSEPVFSADAVEAGTHINAVGSFRPSMQELPTGLIEKAEKIVVESKGAALEETGDLQVPIQKGVFSQEQIYAELGEIVLGKRAGRESAKEVTIFKSVGLAAMDVVIAKTIYDRAVAKGFGQKVTL